jgi:hypothetical protein
LGTCLVVCDGHATLHALSVEVGWYISFERCAQLSLEALRPSSRWTRPFSCAWISFEIARHWLMLFPSTLMRFGAGEMSATVLERLAIA